MKSLREQRSENRKASIIFMVQTGEYSLGYALSKVEDLSDAGILTETDYQYLSNYINGLLDNNNK